MAVVPDDRRCTKVKKDGERCKSRALLDDQVCLLHSPRAAEVRAKAVQKASEHRTEQAEARDRALERSKLSFRQALAVELDEKRVAVIRELLDKALEDSDRLTLLRLLDQAYGKPTETVITEAGDPFQMSEADLYKWLREDERPSAKQAEGQQ